MATRRENRDAYEAGRREGRRILDERGYEGALRFLELSVRGTPRIEGIYASIVDFEERQGLQSHPSRTLWFVVATGREGVDWVRTVNDEDLPTLS